MEVAAVCVNYHRLRLHGFGLTGRTLSRKMSAMTVGECNPIHLQTQHANLSARVRGNGRHDFALSNRAFAHDDPTVYRNVGSGAQIERVAGRRRRGRNPTDDANRNKRADRNDDARRSLRQRVPRLQNSQHQCERPIAQCRESNTVHAVIFQGASGTSPIR